MITEDQLEQLCLGWFQSIAYDYVCGYDIIGAGTSEIRRMLIGRELFEETV